MNTFTFKTVPGGFPKISKGGNFYIASARPSFQEAATYLCFSVDKLEYVIFPADDTVIIDGTINAPGTFTVSTLSDALNVLFPKAKSSSGGSGLTVSFFSSSDIPANVNSNDGVLYDFGLRFKSSIPGYINGIKYYKGAGSTGSRIGRIWTSDGSKLAEVSFLNETASGWQLMSLQAPLLIAAETMYVVSVFSTSGDYSFTASYFNSEVRSQVLTAPAISNGVLGQGSSASPGVFPSQSFNKSNYYVDIIFAAR